MSQRGKSTSGSHKSRGRAPRPLLSPLPVPEIAQGLRGGEDPSTAPSTHLHNGGETDATRRGLQKGLMGTRHRPGFLHLRWILQPQNPRRRLGQTPLWLRKQRLPLVLAVQLWTDPWEAGASGGQKGVGRSGRAAQTSDFLLAHGERWEGALAPSLLLSLASCPKPSPPTGGQISSPSPYQTIGSSVGGRGLPASSKASICCPLPPILISDLCREPFNLSQSPVPLISQEAGQAKKGFYPNLRDLERSSGL